VAGGLVDSHSDESSRVASLDLSSFPEPPLHAVRQWAAEVLAAAPDECVEDAMLTVTELVSNVYQHATMPCYVRLAAHPAEAVVRIEVDDGETDRMPVLGTSRLGPFRGRGLVIVDNVAQRWGITKLEWGKTVWVDLPFDPVV
jgi:anti-sigma regulatory factor (Ser/Thr protein kinase)